ncbi:MAG: LytTR family DNA-binding domain-containing protein [bacterium]|nr:LytTR family DNA-binding domain-containing protein [bacterium]
MKTRCLIVDDDERSIDLLEVILSDIDGVTVVGKADNGYEALKKAEDLQPDIVFLDIKMPLLDGIQVSERLTKNSQLPLIALVTGHKEYVHDGYAANASAFILKPFKPEDIGQNLERLRKKIRLCKKGMLSSADGVLHVQNSGAAEIAGTYSTPDYVQIETEKGANGFHIRDILFFYAEGRELFMQLVYGKPETIVLQMKDLEEEFVPRSFLRVHYSYLVNTAHIKEIFRIGKRSYCIRMSDSSEYIPISKRYLAQIGGIKKLCAMLKLSLRKD